MEPLNWGIIGCGNVTEHKSGPAFYKIKNSRLKAVMRRDPAKAKDYAERHGVESWYDKADEIIQHPDIDAIYIATPPNMHIHYAIQAVQHNKSVYIEKPLGITLKECLKFKNILSGSGLMAWVAYYRRALPYFIKIKEMIDQGLTGHIREVAIKLHKTAHKADTEDSKPWRVRPEIAGGGYFYDLAAHQIDLLDYFFGKITFVEAKATNQCGLYEAEDNITARFKVSEDISVTGDWNFCARPENEVDEFIIYGSKAVLSFSCFRMSPIKLIGQTEHSFSFERPGVIQQDYIQHIVDQLSGKAPYLSNIEDAIRTNELMEKCLKDYYRLNI